LVVLLKERDGERVLPIWIGPHEGHLIKWQLAGGSAPRPLTYELMARLLETAQAQVERMAVSRLHDEVFYATLWVRVGGRTHEVDARPSDALNLALRLDAPIFVDEAVLEKAGARADGLLDKLEREAGQSKEGEPAPAEAATGWTWISVEPPEFNRPPRPPDEPKQAA
jgi:hypothetical protein